MNKIYMSLIDSILSTLVIYILTSHIGFINE
ncbi:Uncharacterised protein [Citrobacter koseri]|nr:Uncharacterised protein [Citrobacter koseri]